jgi:diguanylate cyclase (GGDEF)-like protein
MRQVTTCRHSKIDWVKQNMKRNWLHWIVGRSLKGRLYLLISFLGILPMLGVMNTYLVMGTDRMVHATHDRATRGTIYLERINGIIFAGVMESRGIYMSPDWKTAEPFAARLEASLGKLTETARLWRDSATIEQHGNIDELSKSIIQFVRFRQDLIRLAREEGPAAARLVGDNETARGIRTALNERLQVLARAYEAEIARLGVQIDEKDRNDIRALAALAMLATIALLGGFVLVRGALVSPLFGMKNTMLRLAGGSLDVKVHDTERKDEIGEMARTVEVFHAASVERQKLNREARLLSQLNEWLQSCKSLDELYQMVGDFLALMLPGCAGSLYIYSNSRDVLESARAWNGGVTVVSMHPDDCWGLRRGRAYTFGDNEIDFACSHVASSEPGKYCCIPILAHGETIGLLHLAFTCVHQHGAAATLSDDIIEQRRLGLMCAEQISMAIANVKLRDQLRDQSIRDALTGMYNRRYMLETCRREFARAKRSSESVSILSLDVDHFKKFNDNHGHDAGDVVLRAVAECLKTSFRDEDVPCRFGGEEFIVLLPGASPIDAARRANEVRQKIEALTVRYLDSALPKVTMSIGVAAYPQSGDNPQDVLKAADDALYVAKEAGRNRVEIAASSITKAVASEAISSDPNVEDSGKSAQYSKASEVALIAA